MKAYLANGLFSTGDRYVNEVIGELIRLRVPNLDIYIPQENLILNDKNGYAPSSIIAAGDDAFLMESDFLIAVLDGIEIDSGVACEIGKFSTLGRPIFGLFTDIRQDGRTNPLKIEALIADPLENQFIYRNLYVVGQIKNSGGTIYSSIEELVDSIAQIYGK